MNPTTEAPETQAAEDDRAQKELTNKVGVTLTAQPKSGGAPSCPDSASARRRSDPPGDYSARRIALYTASQWAETSSRARAVVSAADSRRLITASTSLRRLSRTSTLAAMLLSSWASTSLSLLAPIWSSLEGAPQIG